MMGFSLYTPVFGFLRCPQGIVAARRCFVEK
jgi:hypothetical protein